MSHHGAGAAVAVAEAVAVAVAVAVATVRGGRGEGWVAAAAVVTRRRGGGYQGQQLSGGRGRLSVLTAPGVPSYTWSDRHLVLTLENRIAATPRNWN